jgi:hypothetical protein
MSETEHGPVTDTEFKTRCQCGIDNCPKRLGLNEGYPLGYIDSDDALGQKMIEVWNDRTR